ncbi:hypothetical protein DPMN_001901, partial [Dreissena polymorpha]
LANAGGLAGWLAGGRNKLVQQCPVKCIVVERAFGLPKSRFRCLHKTGCCLLMRHDECCQAVAA